LFRFYAGTNSAQGAEQKGKTMNAKQQVAINGLVNKFIEDLDLTGNALMHGSIRKVMQAKNTEQSVVALEYLLESIKKSLPNN